MKNHKELGSYDAVGELHEKSGVLIQLVGDVYGHKRFEDGNTIETPWIKNIVKIGDGKFCATTSMDDSCYFNASDVVDMNMAFRLKLVPTIVENWSFTSDDEMANIVSQAVAEYNRISLSFATSNDDVRAELNVDADSHVALTGTLGGESVTIRDIISVSKRGASPYIKVTSLSGDYFIDRGAPSIDARYHVPNLRGFLINLRKGVIKETMMSFSEMGGYYCFNLDEGRRIYIAKKNVVDGKLLYMHRHPNKSVDISEFINQLH